MFSSYYIYLARMALDILKGEVLLYSSPAELFTSLIEAN